MKKKYINSNQYFDIYSFDEGDEQRILKMRQINRNKKANSMAKKKNGAALNPHLEGG